MNLPEHATEEAVLKALHDTIGTRLKEIKARTQEQLEATGATRVDAKLPDGTKVGTIYRPTASTEAHVTDPEKYLKWVREHAPSEITSRVVTEVRASYTKALLAQLTATGAPVWADADGVAHDVPGVEIVPTRNTTHSVRLTKDGPEKIAEAWRNGELAHLDVLPQLTAGGEQ
ncbi:MAG TPA: hypothetical protein VFN05_05520 [Actinomycetes bacterium]|nr:hypothetical protein [Actinomycetes bacterium]